ncbi:hypothetical protein QJS66_15925 [Kocuria rhizophila]|nr:hypothetical protein QJS66_15925 [Kocuria rhizophila]
MDASLRAYYEVGVPYACPPRWTPCVTLPLRPGLAHRLPQRASARRTSSRTTARACAGPAPPRAGRKPSLPGSGVRLPGRRAGLPDTRPFPTPPQPTPRSLHRGRELGRDGARVPLPWSPVGG